MTESKPVWNIEADKVGVHTIEYGGKRVRGVRSLSFYCEASNLPRVEMLIHPDTFNLKGELDVSITVPHFCPDCRQNLSKVWVELCNEKQYAYVGCICKVKE